MPLFTRKPRPSIAGEKKNNATDTSPSNMWDDLGNLLASLSPVSSAYAEEQPEGGTNNPSKKKLKIPKGFASEAEYREALENERRKIEGFPRTPYIDHLLNIENPTRNPKINERGLYQMRKIFRDDGKIHYFPRWPSLVEGKPTDNESLFAGHQLKIERFQKRFDRLPNDWELYSAFFSGGNYLPERLEQMVTDPSANNIRFDKWQGEDGKIHEDKLGNSLQSNPGVMYKMFALSYNDAFPGTFKDPYNLNQAEQDWVEKQHNVNKPLLQQLNPYTVENLKRFMVDVQGGNENRRTWDKPKTSYLLRRRSLSRQR